MKELSLSEQAGVVFLLAGDVGGFDEADVLSWARRVREAYSDVPEWVEELIDSGGEGALPILGKYGVFETPQDYAALAEYCYRNRLGNDSEICSEVYSLWQHYEDDPELRDDVRLLLDASNRLYSGDPSGDEFYGRFLKTYRRLEGRLT